MSLAKTMKTLSILGTGWLGLELAVYLQHKYRVKVSSRTKEKIPFYENLGFDTYLFNEEDTSNLPKLLDCDYLFINFPPSKFKGYINFLDAIYTNEQIDSIKKIIFISSTSIYPKDDGIYTEEVEIVEPFSQIVFEAEQKIEKQTHIIFRCAGLMGGSRMAGKMFSDKEVLDGNSPVNYIHRDDILSATNFVIENDINGIFNLCAPQHPTKKEVYTTNSLRYGFETPVFLNVFQKERIIDGSKITKLGFQYQHPNPLAF